MVIIMKKIVSILLSLTICFMFCAQAFAVNTDEEVISSMTTSEGQQYQITSTESNGAYTLRGYLNDVLTEEYTVIPGSAKYTKITYDNSGEASNQTVVIDNAITTPKSVIPSPMLIASNGGYMGSMFYDNIQYTYKIDCYATASSSASYWDVQSFSGSMAELVVQLIGALGITASLATGVAQSFLVACLFVSIDNIIKNKTTLRLRSNVTSYNITGQSTNPIDHSNHSGVIYGKKAVITEQSKYYNQTFTEGYTPSMWGYGEFGRAMFKAVYNNDWTPTGWTSSL